MKERTRARASQPDPSVYNLTNCRGIISTESDAATNNRPSTNVMAKPSMRVRNDMEVALLS